MKIIHFADLHLGIDTIGKVDPVTGLPVRVMDVINALDEVVEYVEVHQPDLVLFAGDAYHRNSPNPTLVDLFSQRIVRMSNVCPVVIVIGNHDMFGDRSKKTALDLFSSVEVPNVYIGNKPTNFRIETEAGTIVVSTMPYPSKHETQEQFLDSMDMLYGSIYDEDVFSVLLAHCSIEGAEYGSEQFIGTLGHDPIFPIDVIRSYPYNYIALGHIHLLQDLGTDDTCPIIYPGSLIPLDFGDEGKDAGFIELDLDTGALEFIDIKARQFITVRVNNPEYDPVDLALDEADKLGDSLHGAIVRVLIEINDDYPVNTEDILKYYYNMGCISCVVNVIRKHQTRAVRLDGTSAVSLTPTQLVKLYFKDTGVNGKALKELMMVAKEIMDD